MQTEDLSQALEMFLLLCAAAVAGGIVGFQREVMRKAAGLRTHMLVSVGTALFVVISLRYGMNSDGISRVVQGLATGIGFIGGGAILKLSDEREIRGLTTAASLWATAALGIAAGTGLVFTAILGALLTVVILAVVGWVEHKLEPSEKNKA